MTSIPLRAVSSARPDLDGLVPRTPHSRSGRFDEADLAVPTDTGEDADSDGQSDSDPLLGNNNGAEEPPDSPLQSATFDPLTSGTRFSTVGVAVMVFLVFLAGVVYRKSEEEAGYDHRVHGGHSSYGLISYENYTKFPLTPKQYRAECRKIHEGGMRHMAYWTDMMMDVLHPPFAPGSDEGVCTRTVTYMLGSEVGLMGDLALLAQVAALADLVSPWMPQSSVTSLKAFIVTSNNEHFSSMTPNGTAASRCIMCAIYALGFLRSSVAGGRTTSPTFGHCVPDRSRGVSPLHHRVSLPRFVRFSDLTSEQNLPLVLDLQGNGQLPPGYTRADRYLTGIGYASKLECCRPTYLLLGCKLTNRTLPLRTPVLRRI